MSVSFAHPPLFKSGSEFVVFHTHAHEVVRGETTGWLEQSMNCRGALRIVLMYRKGAELHMAPRFKSQPPLKKSQNKSQHGTLNVRFCHLQAMPGSLRSIVVVWSQLDSSKSLEIAVGDVINVADGADIPWA